MCFSFASHGIKFSDYSNYFVFIPPNFHYDGIPSHYSQWKTLTESTNYNLLVQHYFCCWMIGFISVCTISSILKMSIHPFHWLQRIIFVSLLLSMIHCNWYLIWIFFCSSQIYAYSYVRSVKCGSLKWWNGFCLKEITFHNRLSIELQIRWISKMLVTYQIRTFDKLKRCQRGEKFSVWPFKDWLWSIQPYHFKKSVWFQSIGTHNVEQWLLTVISRIIWTHSVMNGNQSSCFTWKFSNRIGH